MKTTVDFDLHNRHCEALMREIVKRTTEAIDDVDKLDANHKKELAERILFDICVILDGSAHGGDMNGKPIYPFLGFYINGDLDDVLIADDGSATHEYISDLINEQLSS